MGKHSKFEYYANQAKQRKDFSMKKDNGLTGNAPIPHDLWRRIIPIAREYDKGYASIATLYTYLLSNVNGQVENDRYMSAFTSVDRIAAETGIGRNRVSRLSDVLEAVGLLVTVYDYTGNKREKLYYPQYYSELTDGDIRERLSELG